MDVYHELDVNFDFYRRCYYYIFINIIAVIISLIFFGIYFMTFNKFSYYCFIPLIISIFISIIYEFFDYINNHDNVKNIDII